MLVLPSNRVKVSSGLHDKQISQVGLALFADLFRHACIFVTFGENLK